MDSQEAETPRAAGHSAPGPAGASKPTVKRSVVFVEDPGHGWLAVDNADIKALGIARRISPYSYMTPQRSFLEEDCDASVFLAAAKAAGWALTVKSRSLDKPAPLRSYAAFKPEWIEEPMRVGMHARLHSGEKAIVESMHRGSIVLRGESGNRYGADSTTACGSFLTEALWLRMQEYAKRAAAVGARRPDESSLAP